MSEIPVPATAGLSDAAGPPPWARVYQIGVVVRDLDQAVRFYQGLGIGPFREGPSAYTVERIVRGTSSPETQVRGRIADLGALEFELLQPVAGRSVQGEFLERHGEGVVHLCAYTDDLDRDIAWMAERGTQVISYGRLADGGRFAYFDTVATGGLVFELYQLGPDGEQIPDQTDPDQEV